MIKKNKNWEEEEMDKVTLKFLADVLYIKKVICFEEFEAIMCASRPTDLDEIVENMLCDVYNPNIRGVING